MVALRIDTQDQREERAPFLLRRLGDLGRECGHGLFDVTDDVLHVLGGFARERHTPLRALPDLDQRRWLGARFDGQVEELAHRVGVALPGHALGRLDQRRLRLGAVRRLRGVLCGDRQTPDR